MRPVHDPTQSIIGGMPGPGAAEEHRELLPIVAAPANVFDLLAGCRLEAWSSFIDLPPAEHSSLASKARRLCGRLVRLFCSP